MNSASSSATLREGVDGVVHGEGGKAVAANDLPAYGTGLRYGREAIIRAAAAAHEPLVAKALAVRSLAPRCERSSADRLSVVR